MAEEIVNLSERVLNIISRIDHLEISPEMTDEELTRLFADEVNNLADLPGLLKKPAALLLANRIRLIRPDLGHELEEEANALLVAETHNPLCSTRGSGLHLQVGEGGSRIINALTEIVPALKKKVEE